MANMWEGDVKAKGKIGSLMSEKGKDGGKGPQISAQFIVEAGEKATDADGRQVTVGGKTVTWYTTLTEKTRERIEEGLQNFGMKPQYAEKFLDNTEGGSFGKIPEAHATKCGFGSVVGSLTVEIDEYQGKKRMKVQWLNAAEGRSKNAEDMDFGDMGDDDSEDEKPWEED